MFKSKLFEYKKGNIKKYNEEFNEVVIKEVTKNILKEMNAIELLGIMENIEEWQKRFEAECKEGMCDFEYGFITFIKVGDGKYKVDIEMTIGELCFVLNAIAKRKGVSPFSVANFGVIANV